MTAASIRFGVNASRISHELLQGEVIIINVETGRYYSATGTASDLWSLLVQGGTADEAADLMASAYGVDKQMVGEDVARTINLLLKWGLIDASDAGEGAPNISLPETTRSAWTSPQFDEHSDMWELIKLDPIHEVGEAGWPVPKA